ncbi:MAG: CDP-alcohol phosphatidyltransferase family protein [Acidobacteriota bacterium]
MEWRRRIPWSLTGLRAFLAPTAVCVASLGNAPQAWLGAIIATGFLSDVYDGVLARRWGTATAGLRLADSVTDTIFFLGLLAAAVIRHGPVLRERGWWIAAVLVLEAAQLMVGALKYGRMVSYHSYASKAWGFLLAVATVALLCFDRAFWLVTLALAWGVLCELEGMAMSLLLPEWTHDVKTLHHAAKIRKALLSRHPEHALVG